MTLAEDDDVLPLRFDMEDSVRIPMASYEGPARSLLGILEGEPCRTFIEDVAHTVSTPIPAASAIRVALLKAASAHFDRAVAVSFWRASSNFADLIVVNASPWDRILMKHRKATGKTVLLPRLPQVAWSWRRRSSGPKHNFEPSVDADCTFESEQTERNARVIMVFNLDDRFSNLYTYDHLYSDNPDSPLFPQNVAVMSRNGGFLSSGRFSRPFPSPGTRLELLKSTLREFTHVRKRARTGTPWIVVWEATRFLAESKRLARLLRDVYPSATTVCYAYDIQVPVNLSFAFELAGIRSVALQERIDATMGSHSPHIVNTMLAASPFFAHRARMAPSVALRTAIPVGMWRTDILTRMRFSSILDVTGAEDRRLVLVLPYRVDDRINPPGDTLSMSASALRSFLEDIDRIAQMWPEHLFVIRAKDDSWMALPSLIPTLAQLDMRDNVVVDRVFTELNRTYRIAAHAELVIGNYTSLIDEALSVGIPCLIRDFTHNASALRSEIMNYYPRRLIALDQSELQAKVAEILFDRGESFRAWWEPERARLYGTLSDGCVSERARVIIEAMALGRELAD